MEQKTENIHAHEVPKSLNPEQQKYKNHKNQNAICHLLRHVALKHQKRDVQETTTKGRPGEALGDLTQRIPYFTV